MKNNGLHHDYGEKTKISTMGKWSTTQRLRWLELAKEFAIKTTPKSSLRTYLKIKADPR